MDTSHKSEKRIGIFGGTFNPPHNGHINLALEFKRRLKLQKVIFIPALSPPHKKTKGADASQRFDMTALAVNGISGFEVSNIEIKRNSNSYTVLTLKAFKEAFKNSEFFLLCGSDMFLTLQTWFEAQDIFKLCTVCGAARNEGEYGALLYHAKYLEKLYNASTKIIRITPINISSSDIRDKISKSESVHGLINDFVEQYISSNKLYLTRDNL